MSDELLGSAFEGFRTKMYALSAVVYAERDGQILLLQRAAGSALAGQWFLPGGMVEADERPEDGARRELHEESGLHIDGALELVGAYPMFVYGGNCLQLSYRGRAGDGDLTISEEHDGQRWVDPVAMRAVLTDEVIASIAQGNEHASALVGEVRADLDRYIERIGRS